MGAPKHLTLTRLNEILRRQRAPAFGLAYEPGIKATREEAPSGSRPATVWSERLGRDVHTLSGSERAVLAIILYCPWLFELQEQRMLPFIPAPHPLHGHPLATGLELKQFRGTLIVASELHHYALHPFVKVSKDEEVPGCWIGDFLLFLNDANGPFCVNISVKSKRTEFTVPEVGVTIRTDMKRAAAKEKARHEVERYLYADVEIPTIEVASEELPSILVDNLLGLLLWQKRRPSLTPDQIQVAADAFNDGLERRASALEVISATELSHGINAYEQRIVLMQGIFSRRIRVDLFESHFFVDRPMQPEMQNVLEVFGHWFRRPM
jgi:hypothetical protein